MPVLPTTSQPLRLNPSVALPPATRWSSAAMALLLAACVHSPQAAVPSPGLQGGPTLWEPTAIAPCDRAPTARPALERIGRELQSQGLALQATCNTASGGWVVQVQVVDGTKAHKVVRGPLADGQAVDMGTPAGAARSEAAGASGFSRTCCTTASGCWRSWRATSSTTCRMPGGISRSGVCRPHRLQTPISPHGEPALGALRRCGACATGLEWGAREASRGLTQWSPTGR